MKLDLRGLGPKIIRPTLSWVDVEWRVRRHAPANLDRWTLYDPKVRSDIAARLVNHLNADDKLFEYRIKPLTKENL